MSYSRSLGQTPPPAPAPTSTLSDNAAIGIGIAALLIGGGLGWLGYKYPALQLGGGYAGSYLNVGGGDGRPGLSLRLNGSKRKARFSVEDAPGRTFTLKQMLKANEDDLDVCDWLRSAKVGDVWRDGNITVRVK